MTSLPIVMGMIGFLYSAQIKPLYEARSTILIQYRGANSNSFGLSDFRGSDDLAVTYKRLVRADPFINRVESRNILPPQIDNVRSVLAAATLTRPPVMELIVRHGDREVAKVAVEILAEEFISYAIERSLGEIARRQSAATAQGFPISESLITAQLATSDYLEFLPPVSSPLDPVVPNTRLNIIIGVMLGVMLALGGAILLENLQNKIRSADDLRKRFGVTGLGAIFKWAPKEIAKGEHVMFGHATSSYSEAFRQLRANVEFATVNTPGNVLLISSSRPSEGKSTIVVNLGMAFAQTGKSVVLVDADLRKPVIHKLLALNSSEPGLSNYLIDTAATADEMIVSTQYPGLNVIPSGPIPPNPSELLGLPRMNTLLDSLRERFEIVLLDSPPVLPVADASVLATKVDGLILIAERSINGALLKAALDIIRKTNVEVVGVIANKLKRPLFSFSYYYGDYYEYSSYDNYYAADETNVNSNGRFVARIAQRTRSLISKLRRN